MEYLGGVIAIGSVVTVLGIGVIIKYLTPKSTPRQSEYQSGVIPHQYDANRGGKRTRKSVKR
jgi:hypothetical protein